jgi:hypothetical protein
MMTEHHERATRWPDDEFNAALRALYPPVSAGTDARDRVRVAVWGRASAGATAEVAQTLNTEADPLGQGQRGKRLW